MSDTNKKDSSPGKFWVNWFDPRALAVLGVILVALCCVASVIALWANNAAQPVAITRPAQGAALEVGKLGDIEGTASPGAQIKLYDGSTLLGEARADSSGRWNFPVPAGLAAGGQTLRADALDAGNRLTSASVAWTLVDPSAVARAPGVKPAFTAPAAGSAFVAGQQINFAGTAGPGATVRLLAADGRVLGTTIAGADGVWRLQVPAAVGIGPITARVVGPDGANLDSAPLSLIFNPAATAIPPTPAPPALLAPSFGVLPGVFPPANPLKEAPAGVKGAAYDAVTELAGTAGPNARVRLFDGDIVIGETTADAKGNWSVKIATPFALGPHSITAAAVDGAAIGPRSVAQVFTLVPVQVVAVAPTKPPEPTRLPEPTKAPEPTKIPEPTKAIEPTKAVTAALPAPAATLAPTKAPEATQAAPAAVKPVFLAPPPGANVVAGQPIEFSGTAAPGATVQIIGADGKVIGTAIAGADGKWTFKLPAASVGMGPFTVRVIGPNGAALDSAPLAVNIAPAPTVAPAATAAATQAAPAVAPSATLAPAATAAPIVAPTATSAATKAPEATKAAPAAAVTATARPTNPPEATKVVAQAATAAPTNPPEATKVVAQAATAAPTKAPEASPTPRVLLGVTGDQPEGATSLPIVIGAAAVLALAAMALTRRRIR